MRARLAAALGALLVTGCDSAPKSSEPSLPPPRIISGPISVAAACTGPSPSARPAEPSLAAAPGDPRELVAAWLENPAGTVEGAGIRLRAGGGAGSVRDERSVCGADAGHAAAGG